MSTRDSNAVHPGDLIVSVDGKPVTSREGAALFLDPPPGRHELAVRRRDAARTFTFAPTGDCPGITTRMESGESVRSGDPLSSRGRTISYGDGIDGYVRGSPAEAVEDLSRRLDALLDDVVRVGAEIATLGRDTIGTPEGRRLSRLQSFREQAENLEANVRTLRWRLARLQSLVGPDDSRFGFGVRCTACLSRVTANREYYVRYREDPAVALVRDGSAAATGGLRVGDVIVEVDGIGIQTEAAGLAYARAREGDSRSMRVTVLRDGKRVQLTFVVDK